MTVLALITTARCADLTSLCVDSLKQYAPKVTRLILVNQMDRDLRRWLAETGEVYFVNDRAHGDGSDHAGAIEAVRASGTVEAYHPDLVVLIDNDCVILSPQWYSELVSAFDDPVVGGWGAEWVVDRSVLHASMLAMRAVDFMHATTFRPWASSATAGAYSPAKMRTGYRDTGGVACDELRAMGFRLVGLTRNSFAFDRDGWATYWAGVPSRPLWAHLGSGTFAVRPAWPRRWVRALKASAGHRMAKKAIAREQRRAAFLAWGRAWLGTPPRLREMIHGRPHEGKMVENHQ